MEKFVEELRRELTGDILPFWMERMPDPRGGFYGRIDGRGRLDEDSCKGGILNARILWTFAAAYEALGKPEYLKTAERAADYLCEHFIDPEFGGTYWSVDPEGRPLETKKQIYSIAFTVYAFAQMYSATRQEKYLEKAVVLYREIEAHSFDPVENGYLEAFTRDWRPIEDMRLSEKDRNDAKTMNTHLHILEAYTGLYRVWKDATLKESLRNLVCIFLDTIAGTDGHLQLFFGEQWISTCKIVSYGHDIESSWLLYEAASILGDAPLLERTREVCAHIASAAMEGYRKGEGLAYEYDPESGRRDGDRHWWVQAEAVVGCWNQWQCGGGIEWRERALDLWEFIRERIVCGDGEWFWSVREDGSANVDDDRAGFWKCPYHNSRLCLEILARTSGRR